MDISKEYIEMCEKAKKMQGERRGRELNDLFFHKNCIKTLPCMFYGKEIIIKQCYSYNYKSDIRPIEWNDYCIWLPRQDQLQEMLIKSKNWGVQWHLALDYLKLWKEETKAYNKFTSMEQLWLAFVMREKYDKIWNGKDWIKEE